MFEIYLRLDLNMDGVWNSKEHWHRKVPNAVVFDQFDSDSALAKDLYNQTWDAIRQSGPWYYPISTVFYEEGLSLTADKPFAGHPAGEELDPLIPFNQNRTDSFKISIPFIDITSHRYLLTTGFTLCLPMGNFEKTEEIVSFNLVLPIKAGMYLTWMIDRRNNSESEMIYRDEVFTCSFTLHNGLR